MADVSRASAGPAAGGPGRYLAGSDDPALLDRALAADPRVLIVRRPAADVLAIETTAEVVEELRSRHAGRLVIEPDAELGTLPPAGPGGDPVR